MFIAIESITHSLVPLALASAKGGKIENDNCQCMRCVRIGTTYLWKKFQATPKQ